MTELEGLAPDFSDLLACLEETGAQYMLVGGYAVMAHGHVRATSDIDIWVRATPENGVRVLAAMEAFGLPPGLDVATLSEVRGTPRTGFRFGRPPLAVDLLTSIAGVDFEEAWSEVERRRIGELEINVIGRAALVKNKRSTGRRRDELDADELDRLAQLGSS